MTGWDSLRASDNYAALLDVSARLGSNPLQVQGPGGNTSIKSEGCMWVKASGTWLADALTKDIMVPVDAAALLASLDQDIPDTGFVPADVAQTDLRPSIETSFHAALPWPVVLHTHCVATLATAIRADAAAVVADKLAEFDAAFVPYVKPGRDLTRAILAATTPKTRVIVLGNHGLICCGCTPASAEDLLRRVSAALEPRGLLSAIPTFDDLAESLGGTGWVPGPPQSQHVGLTDNILGLANGETLYPDHLVFLGPGIALGDPFTTDLSDSLERIEHLDPPRRFVVFPGMGVAIPGGSSPAVQAMARCLGDVLLRVPAGTKLNRLTAADEAALLDWDAEAYRKSLAARE
ncbi:class II aldolase/adducin family protein [Actibacterium sp. 188UL27-1]|uniref:class II aldolase/adducin family protein n=1 Tax=Actibacterium sp. 188UL27-1 TaxID=2786961 RepID=UPI00195EF184|nr:class II aldolase/adducin family protein [Actibacterium sp. 188UL27-1]MBM7069399.1 class II aldolase [Actibacterium sp. 188UL27-1]